MLDPAYLRRKELAIKLERRFPDCFIPRYSMVMFHPEIPYAEAQRRGQVQQRILEEMDEQSAAGRVDFDVAQKLIADRLS